MNRMLRYFGAVSLSLGLAACGSSSNNNVPETPDPEPPETLGTVVDVAAENGNFTTLVDLLERTNLDEALSNPDGTFTVFAPTDDAFAALGEETLAALLDDPETLSNILTYHVYGEAEVDSTAAVAAAGDTLEMLNGASVGLSLDGEDLLVNLSLVTATDVQADNGVIHVIDAVLTPPAERGEPTMTIAEIASETEDLSTLVTALGAAELVDTLDNPDANFTVFAPTNAAFEMVGEEALDALLADREALESVLLQHVYTKGEVNSISAYAANGTSLEMGNGEEVPVAIQERVLRVGGAEVVMTDIYATNGVVHVIDMVIVGDLELPAPPESIVEVASGDENFETLTAALEATGLDDTLANLDESFTVFAPTDAAFDALPEGTVANLLENDLDTLEQILRYHVIVGSQIQADAARIAASSDEPTVEMGNGALAGLSIDGDNLLINLSRVVTPNVMADNGVIHAIDKVMMPPAERDEPTGTIVDVAVADGRFETLVEALTIANLDGTLADEESRYTVFAPTDAAFDMIPEDVLNALLADAEALDEVLKNHVVEGEVNSVAAFTLNGKAAPTLSGYQAPINIVDGSLEVGGVTIETFDIFTTNGIIHVIDAVIVGDAELPEPAVPMSLVDVAQSDENFSTLVELLDAAGLVETLDNLEASFTVFAPTNAAFEALDDGVVDGLRAEPDDLAEVLLYHVTAGAVNSTAAVELAAEEDSFVTMANTAADDAALSLSGETLYINLSQVIIEDVLADNGVIHAVDKVMLPPTMRGEPTMSIADVVGDDENFSTLLVALQEAGLVGTFADENASFTVFAPTNAAFDKIPGAQLEALLADEVALDEVLKNHVVGAEVNSIAAFELNGGTATTLSTYEAPIAITDGSLMVGGAVVEVTDIYTTNGIIHVIDTVIVGDAELPQP